MLKIFLMFSKREWALIALSVGLIVLGVWLDLLVPEYLGEMFTAIGHGTATAGEMWRLGGIMIGLAIASCATAVVIAWIGAVVSSSHSARLRKHVFERVGDMGLGEIKNFSVPSLITRSTNDVNQVRLFTSMAIQILFRAPIMAVWAMLRILDSSWELSLVTFIAVAALVTVLTLLIIIVMPRFNKIQTLTDKLNQVSRENLTGLRVVRAFGAEDYEQQKFESANISLVKNNIFVNRGLGIFWPFMSLLVSVLSVVIYWVGSSIIASGNAPGGDVEFFGALTVFNQYSVQVVFSFVMMIMVLIMLPRTIVSARRIREVIIVASPTETQPTSGRAENDPTIKFNGVNFKYPGAEENVLTDINLEIAAGQTVAFIGGTGCGKSTLVNLLPRIYAATSGEIKIGNTCINDMQLTELNNVIGYVPQTAVLFKGTIRSNVAFGEVNGEPISEESVDAALKTAQAWDFVQGLEGGLDADVAQAGKNLSGGQKQRIGIARVLARRPKIVIFDDTFSALDYKTDRALRTALRQDMADATKLIVAQRIGTIRDCDQIFVMDKGHIVGRGTHDELMKSSAVYQEIARSQLSKEELGGAK